MACFLGGGLRFLGLERPGLVVLPVGGGHPVVSVLPGSFRFSAF